MMSNSRFSLSLIIALSFMSYTSIVHSMNTYEQGQYCDTASRCINPITPSVMVTSPNHLATQAGINILKKGGNAVDAAIAVASTLAVVYPQMNTIGGDNFWLIYNAKDQTVVGLNGSGRSGQKATIDFYRQQGFNRIPARGYLAINTVPGAISGWDEAYRYAAKNMEKSLPWPELFDSAINYAKDGFPVSHSFSYWSQINIDPNDKEFRDLTRFNTFSDIFLKQGKQPYQTGEILKQPELAHSLTLIAENGANEFYQGQIAHNIVNDLQKNGGILTLEDFANHKAQWMTPIHVNYRGYTAYNLPPNTQGIASLEILNILNNIDVKSLGEGSADYYHTMIEATKEAFIDRDQYLTDPAFNNIPLDFLLSEQHGKDQAQRINMAQAKQNLTLLDPKGDTVWFGVVDEEGNSVSMIQSIYHDFGSGIVAKDTGILLQNRGSFFSLDPKHINKLEPNKLTFHTLNPAMLLKDNKPYLVYGTMGGEGQPQTQAALVTRIIDFGLLPQDAVNAPRWLYGRTWGATSNDIKIESRVNESIIELLRKKGHPIKIESPYTDIMGHAGVILIDHENHVLYGASDPRGDGEAAGY